MHNAAPFHQRTLCKVSRPSLMRPFFFFFSCTSSLPFSFLKTSNYKNNDDAGYTLYNVLQQQSQAASQADEAGAAVVDASNGTASAAAGGDVDAPTALCVYIM